MPLKKESKKAADVNIYTDADARSTAVLATKTDIASESDMIAGSKRSLAECLDTDELHSEVLYDNMYTGNDDGLGIVREPIEKVSKTAMTWAKKPFQANDLDFNQYLDDLDFHEGIQPSSGEATRLGIYTAIRHEQLVIKGILITAVMATTSPPGATRSHRGHVVLGLGGPADEQDSGPDEIYSLSSAERCLL